MKAKLLIISTCIVASLFSIMHLFTSKSFETIQAKSIEAEETRTDFNRVYFDYTGHWYQLFEGGYWHEAKYHCSYRGGHLVTIGSPEENALIHDFYAGFNDGHIGATDEVEEGVWRWVTGEPLSTTYTNWRQDEPNNVDNEDYCVMEQGLWNDVKDGGRPFVCEFTQNIMGRIVNVFGNVQLNDEPVNSGNFVLPGDVVRTYENGFASIEFFLGDTVKELNIGSNTMILITDDSVVSDMSMEFWMGVLRGKVDQLPEGVKFEVWTPQAVIGVRGTEWIIEGDEDITIVTVLDGSVEVSTPNEPDETVQVEKNYEVQVTSEGVGEPYEIDPNDIDDWWSMYEPVLYLPLISR